MRERLKNLAALLCFGVAILGALVLVGWTFQIELLKRVYPTFVSMNPVTAVGFMLSSFAIFLLRAKKDSNNTSALRYHTAKMCALVVVAIGVLKLINAWTGWSFGIDEILFRAKLDDVGNAFPNRIAPNTAMCFVLLGMSILLLDFERRFFLRPAECFALSCALVSWMALAGYAYQSPLLYGIASFIPMALHTAFAFLCLTCAALSVRPEKGLVGFITSDTVGGMILRRALPALFLIEFSLAWLTTLGARRYFYSEQTADALFAVLTFVVCSMFVVRGAASLNRAEAERQKVQRDLEKSAAEVQDLYNNSPCGYHSVDANGYFIAINDTELSWRGAAREELIGKVRHRDLVAPETQAAYDKGFEQFKNSGEVHDLEFKLLRKDGSTMDVLLNASSVLDERGKIKFSRSTMFDITRRKKAEAERDRFFRLPLDFLCVAGLDGYLKKMNPAFQLALGFRTEDLLARPILEFVHPEDRAATLAELERLKQGGSTIQFENRLLCADGGCKWLSWKAQPFPDEGIFYATARDVTERKETEQKIQKLNHDLQQRAVALEAANKELESFSYSVSHDLRAPLRHIAGFIDMLRSELGDLQNTKINRFLNVIADSARQMGRLIDELLVFSKMGRVDVQKIKIDTRDLVREAIDNLSAETAGRNIIWKVEPLPMVHADPALLRQAFVNLISNAVKYSAPRDPACVEIGFQDSAEATVIFVRDNGVGFDMAYADKLFGVFQRLHHADEFEGTGVGLANVRRIIQRHGGRTWAESVVNHGATFYFSLPKTQENP